MDFDACVLIGRFQPFHLGHLAAVEQGLQLAPQVVIVLGSHRAMRSLRVPWNTNERIEMIHQSVSPKKRQRIHCVGVRDRLYNEGLWQHNVRQEVANIVGASARIALVGHIKDASSYYLKHFPEWHLHDTGCIQGLNATDFRLRYFTTTAHAIPYTQFVTKRVSSFLKHFRKTLSFANILEEQQAQTRKPASENTDSLMPRRLIFFWCNGYVYLQNILKFGDRHEWSLPEVPDQHISWETTFPSAERSEEHTFSGWQNIGILGQRPSQVQAIRFHTSPCPDLQRLFPGGKWLLWDDLISLYEDQWSADHLQICRALLC